MALQLRSDVARFVRSVQCEGGEVNLTEGEADTLGRIVDRLDNLIAALSLPLPDAIHVKAIRGSLPSVRKELAEAIGYPDEEEDDGA